MQEDNTCARDFPAPGPSTTGTTTVTRSLIANDKVEQLIDEVQKRPALYKKDLKQYSDINVKKKLWEEVCEVLVSDWGALSVNERKEQGHEIQKKWNNLRTCFARELKAQKSVKSGQAASKRRPYVYFERMLFLVPCMESRPTEGSIENSESNQDDGDLSEEAESHLQRKRKTKQSNFDDQILKALKSNEDADINYCLSLVPFMKEFTSDEKLEVRIKILQIFQEIKQNRLLPNTSFSSQCKQASRRVTPSNSVRIISNELIQPQNSRQVHSTQHPTEFQQQLQLSSPSPENQTPPPQYITPSPCGDSTVISYWSNFSEQSDSELIDL